MQDLRPGVASWAMAQLEKMTLAQKIAQMIVARAESFYKSSDDPAYQRLVDFVERLQVGGFTFFQGEPLEQAFLTNDLQQRSALPLLVSQDMEFGVGMRLEEATTFPYMMAVGATRNPDYAYSVGQVTAREALALGVHHVFAPVADVNNNPFNPIINVRSFGEEPALVVRMVIAAIQGLQEGGVIATAKHFPGHGDTATDSHADLPTLPISRERLDALELIPFRAAIAAGVRSMMVGHLAFPLLDPEATLPATLSRNVVTGLLREELGFDGLIVTDAMDMDGVYKLFGIGQAAVMAVEAGVDMILTPKDEYAAHDAILHAVDEGCISEARIDQSVLRILREKEQLGLHQKRTVDLNDLRDHVATQPHQMASENLARASLTLLRNENDVLPLLDASFRYLCIMLSDIDDPSVGRYFASKMQAQISDATLTSRLIHHHAATEHYEDTLHEAASHDVILVAAFVKVRAWSGRIDLSDAHRSFVNALSKIGKPVVLIAFGNPYIVMGIEQPDVYITAYSGCEASQKAVAEALFGKRGFQGRLPITIPDHFSYGEGIQLKPVTIQQS